jgi:hypothetical protein
VIEYLLHKMPEAERDSFEEQYFDDSEIYDQIREVEAELLDGHARGELSASQRELVEKYLLTSSLQRQKLLVARTLARRFPSPARRSAPWRSIAAAAAIVLLAGGVAWLAWENAALRRDLTRAATKPTSKQEQQLPQQVVEARLSPTSRGTAQSIVAVPLAADSEILRLDLEVDPGEEAQSLSAFIIKDGRAVWSEEPVLKERRSFGFVASVWIPAAALVAGEYEIKLSAGGAPIDYYRFRTLPVK